MVSGNRKRRRILEAIECSAATIAGLAEDADVIEKIGSLVVGALRRGCKILTAGNGGSAAEALHMAEELTGRFRGNRRSLPGIALTADSTTLTCIGNDFGFDEIFARQIEGLGKRGDVLVLFSTSGRAENLRRAVAAATDRNMKVVCFLGRDGGSLHGRGDQELIVRGTATERIQEAHQVALHLILDAVEEAYSRPAAQATGRKTVR